MKYADNASHAAQKARAVKAFSGRTVENIASRTGDYGLSEKQFLVQLTYTYLIEDTPGIWINTVLMEINSLLH